MFHVEAKEVMAERIGAPEVLSVARSTKPDFKVKGRDLSCRDTRGNAEISYKLNYSIPATSDEHKAQSFTKHNERNLCHLPISEMLDEY